MTSIDPVEAANSLDDKRIGKLLMEANQMLSLAVKFHWPDKDGSHVFWETPDELTTGWSHKNHPVSIWVRASRSNYDWTLIHADALAKEYVHRFGKEHGSAKRVKYLATCEDCIPAGSLLPFQNSARNAGLGVDFTHLEIPYSYQEYLIYRWSTDKRAPTWTNRVAPKWSRVK